MHRYSTHRGWYLACHMKGPAALPMQYADSMTAFVVTFFVCPAVVCDTQTRDKTKPVVPTPGQKSSFKALARSKSCVPESHTENNNPTLSCQARNLISKTPRIFGIN